MKDLLQEQVIEIVSEVMNESPAEVGRLTRQQLAAWDSLRHMELIMRLEEEYDVRFTFKEASEIHSVQDIIRLLEVKL